MIRSNRRNSLKKSSARFVVCAAAGALAFGMAMPLAMAQQDPPQAQPKSTAAPKSSAGQAPAAAAAGDAPQGDAWVKLCMNNEQTANKEICLINHEGLEPNTGMVLIAAAVRKAEGEEKQQLLVRVPTAYALVIPAGVQIKIDEGKPIQLQYSICFPTSCQVQMELTKELFDSMRNGKQMVVAAMNIQQKTMGFPVPLTGFGKAYDGTPVDNAKYEEFAAPADGSLPQAPGRACRQGGSGRAAEGRDGSTRSSVRSGQDGARNGTAEAACGEATSHAVSARNWHQESRRPPSGGLRVSVPPLDGARRGRSQCSCRKRKRKIPPRRSSNSSETCGWRSGSSDASGTRFCSET